MLQYTFSINNDLKINLTFNENKEQISKRLCINMYLQNVASFEYLSHRWLKIKLVLFSLVDEYPIDYI